MKKLLIIPILILMAFSSKAPKPTLFVGSLVVSKVIMSEYLNAYLYSDSSVRAYIYNGSAVLFMPYVFGGRKAIDAAPLFNQITILDDQNYVWKNVPGSQTGACTRINVDTFGNAFNYNAKIYGYFFSYMTITLDSSMLMYGGGDTYNFYKIGGGQTQIKPNPLHAPAGKKWVQVAMGNNILARTSTGEVYMWNNGDSNYIQLSFTGNCIDIAASHSDFYMLLIHNYVGGDATLGRLFWLGSQQGYIGDVASRSQPFALTSIFKVVGGGPLPYNVRQVVCDDNTVHFVDSIGDGYGEGDNPIGNIGNGVEAVNKYTYLSPYSWTMNKGEAYSNGTCYKIFTGVKKFQFGTTYTFDNALIDLNDSLWMWGRNKSFDLTLGIANNQEVTWPNAGDVLQPTQMSGLQYPNGTYMNFALSTLSAASSTQSVSVPNGTLVATGIAAKYGTYGYAITSYLWTQVSGPNTATITSPTSATTTITGLISGTYVFRVVSTDNNTGTASSTVSVTYTPGASPCNCAGNLKYRAYQKA